MSPETYTPFDEWYKVRKDDLAKLFGKLAEDELKSMLFNAFEFGARIGASSKK